MILSVFERTLAVYREQSNQKIWKQSFKLSCSQWSFRKAGSWEKKEKNITQRRQNALLFLLTLLAQNAVVVFVMIIKLQRPMKVYIAVIAISKNMVYFQVDSKYKRSEGKGTGPCSAVIMGETWHRGHAQQCREEEHEARKNGCKMNDFATIKTPHDQKMTNTGQNNQANFKHTNVTIILICLVLFFPLVWHFIGTNLCSKRLNVVQKVSCLINITGRI